MLARHRRGIAFAFPPPIKTHHPDDHVMLAVGQHHWYHFGAGAPPSLEPILVGIGIFTGGTARPCWRFRGLRCTDWARGPVRLLPLPAAGGASLGAAGAAEGGERGAAAAAAARAAHHRPAA